MGKKKSEAIAIPFGNGFIPRDYQWKVWQERGKGARFIIKCWPRRAGKDLDAWNMLIAESQKRVGQYWYCFPTGALGRKILWEGFDNEGKTFLDYIPKSEIVSKNSTDMKIQMRNGSIIIVTGVDLIDKSAVGTNGIGYVFSEYSLMNPQAWKFINPIISMNGGFAIFTYTPRGKNHGWTLLKTFKELAKSNPEYYVSHLTADSISKTNPEIYSKQFLKSKRKEIAMENNGDDSLFYQEYFTNFDVAVSESIYGNQIKVLEDQGRYTSLSAIMTDMTIVAMDIGRSDKFVASFYQIRQGKILLVDMFAESFGTPERHAKMIASRGYNLKHIVFPHDARHKKYGATTVVNLFRKHLPAHLHSAITVNPKISRVWVGIDIVKDNFQYLCIDKHNCSEMLDQLKQYTKKFNKSKGVYGDEPGHGEPSHYADSLREGIRFIATRYGYLLNTDDSGYNKGTNKPIDDSMQKIYQERLNTLRLQIK